MHAIDKYSENRKKNVNDKNVERGTKLEAERKTEL